MMVKYLSAYAIVLVLFLALDVLWLNAVGRNFYLSRLGDLLLERPRFAPAAIFYLLYAAGLVYFGVSAGLQSQGWQRAALDGAVFGFFCYLTYDFTNLAMMKKFDASVAIVDTGWGAVASAIASAGTVMIVRLLFR